MTAKALELDFGGVISRMLFETHDLSERALGLPPGTLTWKGPFDPSTDPLWQDMQADRLSERDYWMTRTREVGQGRGKADFHPILRVGPVLRFRFPRSSGSVFFF